MYTSVSSFRVYGCNVSSYSPHVTPLPGDDMKHSGDQEEGTQAHAVHPGSDPLPAGVWQTMQQRHAHEGRHDEELMKKNHTTVTTTYLRLLCVLKNTFKPLTAWV